jgi:hypothetical protein
MIFLGLLYFEIFQTIIRSFFTPKKGISNVLSLASSQDKKGNEIMQQCTSMSRVQHNRDEQQSPYFQRPPEANDREPKG